MYDAFEHRFLGRITFADKKNAVYTTVAVDHYSIRIITLIYKRF